MPYLPLNPNGKVDKPALPFPISEELVSDTDEESISRLSTTEIAVLDIFKAILPTTPYKVQITDNFFDLGGHSLLAPSVVRAIQQRFNVDLPLGVFYKTPTASEISREIEHRLTPVSGSAQVDETSSTYYNDFQTLVDQLDSDYKQATPLSPGGEIRVFVTGATGFIGAFLIRDLMTRGDGKISTVAHVRAQSEAEGIRRLRENCEGYAVWDNSWLPRIQVVVGSLGPDNVGIPQSTWDDLASTVDVVIHNGARVLPYLSDLEPFNRLGQLGA
jgi:L-2-aminoadipate reductase